MSLAGTIEEASVIGQILAAFCIFGSILTALGPLPTILKIRRLKSIEEYPATPYFTWCVSTALWLSYHILNKNILLIAALITSSLLGIFYVSVYILYSNKEKRSAIIFLSVITITSLMTVVYLFMLKLKLVIVIAATVVFFVFLISPMTVVLRVIETKCCSSLPFELPCAAFINGLSYLLYGYLVDNDLALWGTGLATLSIAALQLLCHCIYGDFVGNLKELVCYPCFLFAAVEQELEAEDVKVDVDETKTVITV